MFQKANFLDFTAIIIFENSLIVAPLVVENLKCQQLNSAPENMPFSTKNESTMMGFLRYDKFKNFVRNTIGRIMIAVVIII